MTDNNGYGPGGGQTPTGGEPSGQNYTHSPYGAYPPGQYTQNGQSNQYGQSNQSGQYGQSGQYNQYGQYQQDRPQWPGGPNPHTYHQGPPPNSNRGLVIGVVVLGIIATAAIIAAILFGTGVLGAKDEPTETVSTQDSAQTTEPAPESGAPSPEDGDASPEAADPGDATASPAPDLSATQEPTPDSINDPVIPSSALTFTDGSTFAAAPLPGSVNDIVGFRVEAVDAEPAHTVTVFFDYSCPHCVDFEAIYGPELTELVANGEIALDLRVLSFLPTEFSPVAAEALKIVGHQAPDQLIDFHNSLMAISNENAQNPEPLEAIRGAASEAGVPEEVIADLASEPGHTWALSLTQDAPAGFRGTPTILIDGVEAASIPAGGFADLLK